jgi:uncharacterized protein
MMTERRCGTCSLCCKLPYVRELNKPIDTWCPHARPGHGGCAIYPERPPRCRDFICGWFASTQLGEEWFPACCKMVLSPLRCKTTFSPRPVTRVGTLVTVDPAFPGAWRREPYYSQLREWAQHMQVEIRVGRRCIGLNADGTEREVVRKQAWIEGREEPDVMKELA